MQQPVSKPSVCKPSLSQVSSGHAKGTSNGSLLKYDSILLVDIQNLIESRKKHPNNVLICYLNTRTYRAGEGMGDVTRLEKTFIPTKDYDLSYLTQQPLLDNHFIILYLFYSEKFE